MMTPRQFGLPLPNTSLVGREGELRRLQDLLSRPAVRLVTLTGPGGTGKTRVALRAAGELASRFADGVHFISLAPVRRSELVLPTIAQSLGIGESAQDTVLDQVVVGLADRHLLLVLDNFEQVLEAGPAVAELLRGCPGLKALVTSRIPLHVAGEHEFPVPPLLLPSESPAQTADQIACSDAVRLFAERAAAVRPGFELTPANAADVARICARLDGLPLALELAAARVKLLPPRTLLQHLDHSLSLLTGGPRDAPPRLRTLRDAIAWSYDLLDEPERRLFGRLAVFVKGFTLDAAERVVGPTGAEPLALDILDGIASLVDHSLVIPVEESPEVLGGGPAVEPRFTMLQTIREFALECLARSGEEETLRRSHAEYFRELAERAEPELRGPRQTGWLRRLEAEIDNLRAVLDWSLARDEVELGLRMAAPLYWFWSMRHHYSEGRDWFERARAASTGVTPWRAKAALGAFALAWRAGDYGNARSYLQEAMEVFHALGDRWGIAFATHSLAHIADDLGHDLPRSIRILEESREQFAAIGDEWGSALSERCLGRARIIAGDPDRGITLLEDSLATFRRLGDPWCISTTLHQLGDVAREQGRLADATSHYQESLAVSWEQMDVLTVADALLRLGQILVERGEASRAIRLFAAAEAQREREGIPLYGPVRAGYEQAVATARAQLGDAAFTATWSAGRALPLEQAFAEARGIQRPGIRGSPQPSATTPSQPRVSGRGAALSAREREVLRLIVEGRTDAQIADALFIGRRTVNTHVASILNKLGVGSRAAAAALAVRNSLA